jgi:hypothetical protein
VVAQAAPVVVEVVAVVVVLVTEEQLGPLPAAWHASQQLMQVPTVPCFAVQWAASFLVLHFAPFVVVRQQVTVPGLPQVECAAHFLTAPLQLFGRLGLVPRDSMSATPATHFTYAT